MSIISLQEIMLVVLAGCRYHRLSHASVYKGSA